MIAIVTAYCACHVCCSVHNGGRAANRLYPVVGVTVAGPRSVPFGTVVDISGVGRRIVEDRTDLKYDGRWDVFVGRDQGAHRRAKVFGKQRLDIRIVRWGTDLPADPLVVRRLHRVVTPSVLTEHRLDRHVASAPKSLIVVSNKPALAQIPVVNRASSALPHLRSPGSLRPRFAQDVRRECFEKCQRKSEERAQVLGSRGRAYEVVPLNVARPL